MNKNASAIDQYIGERIKFARRVCSLSQTQLADELGVSFQQVQKFEAGQNRVASPVLYQISAVLNRPLAWFFPEVKDLDEDDEDTNDELLKECEALLESLRDRNQLSLVKEFLLFMSKDE